MKKLYMVLMIVLPIVVGSGGLFEMIRYGSGRASEMNPMMSLLLAVVGMAVGTANILKQMDNANV